MTRALIVLLCLLTLGATVPETARSRAAVARRSAGLSQGLEDAGLKLGSPVFLRIVKDEAVLEAWVEGADTRFSLFRTWPICAFSGAPGPKQRTGDLQAPEGAYFVPPGRMNPASSFHLSFDLGYPNAYDRAHGRTGKHLMVHGDCVSIGCYAMTDEGIEEIWTLMAAAFEAGQPYVRVHAVPFRLDEQNMRTHADSRWIEFWRELAVAWRMFEEDGRPPDATVSDGRYVFTSDAAAPAADPDPAGP